MLQPRVPLTIRIDAFEGPLDLLLHLIQTHELDISTVAVAKVTDAYLRFVKFMHDHQFDLAADFLVLAATLIHWKSRSLLPALPNDTDNASDLESDYLSPEKLVQQLLEHQRYLKRGQSLSLRPHLGIETFTRKTKKSPAEKIWRDLQLSQFILAYQEALVQNRRRHQVLQKETVRIAEKIAYMGRILEPGVLKIFKELISDLKLRPEWVATFLASLELAKLKKLKLHQEVTYGEIFLEMTERFEEIASDQLEEFRG